MAGICFGILYSSGFLIRAAIAILIFFTLYIFRMMGAGDIKLIAVIAGWLDIHMGIRAITLGFIAAAAAAALKLLILGNLKERLIYFVVYIRQILQTKKIIKYYTAQTGEDILVMPLAPFMLCGTLLACMVR